MYQKVQSSMLEVKKVAVNTKRLNVLKKVIDGGKTDDKEILALTTEDIVQMSKTLPDVRDILELQKAVKAGKLIAYLAGAKIE